MAELHSWRYLTPLIQEYARSGDEQLREAVVDVILDWNRTNPPPAGAHVRAWHDGAVVKRTGVLLEILNAYRTREPSPRLGVAGLMALIHQHACALASPSRYTGAGNHGFRQDMCLYFVAQGLPCFPESPKWRKLAFRRLQKQVQTAFSDQGVWRENSPGYHYYMMRLTGDLTHFMRANNVALPKWLGRHVLLAQQFLAHVITLDAKLPPVGDSAAGSIPERVAEHPSLRYAASGGKEGEPPVSRIGWYPQTGDAVFRSTWGSDPETFRNAFYLYLRADSPDKFGHAHEDALSFILWNHGRNWVVDPGKYVPAKDAFRKYIIGQAAHNTYVLNGKPLGPEDHRDRSAQLVGFAEAEDGSVTVVAESQRFSGPASVKRAVIYLPQADTLVVLDVLRSAKTDRWAGHFHLAADLEARIEGHTVTASPPDAATVMDVADSRGAKDQIKMVRGRKEPLLGWGSKRTKRFPLTTLVYSRSGGARAVASVFRWRKPDQPRTHSVEVDEKEPGTWTVRWKSGETSRVLEVRLGPEPVVQRIAGKQ